MPVGVFCGELEESEGFSVVVESVYFVSRFALPNVTPPRPAQPPPMWGCQVDVDRSGLQDTQDQARREGHQAPDLGHGRPGAVPVPQRELLPLSARRRPRLRPHPQGRSPHCPSLITTATRFAVYHEALLPGRRAILPPVHSTQPLGFARTVANP